MTRKSVRLVTISTVLFICMFVASSVYCQDDDTTRNVLKQGLLGAGTGAIASGASGGNAGKGALIGAGTGVIGSVLLDAITTPSSSRRRAPPQAQSQDEYYTDEPVDEYYEEPAPQQSGSSQILKQGLLGAGTGAIASGASGGNAGQGALIGAGTGIIGSALLDTITQPAPQRRVYRRVAKPRVQTQARQTVQVQEQAATPEEGRKKIVKKYDANGKLVSEEEVYY